MIYTIPLNKVNNSILDQVGGKAIGCAKMKKLGLLVPDGIVLTSTAFNEFLLQTGLNKKVKTTINNFSSNSDEKNLKKECSSLQQKIINTDIPEDIKEKLFISYDKLNGPCAVRSSATVEDAKDSAFAGIFHSELNIERDKLIKAVKKCWSNFFSYDVLIQIMRNNIDPSKVGIALLIQEMVPAENAGVIFTMDPTGLDYKSALLSLTEGTGEKLMDGEAESANWKINRKSKKLSGEDENCQISKKLFNKIIKTGLKLEKAMSHPQDVEWAIANNNVYFLQTRPITTLDDISTRDIYWTRELSEERYPKPISPLGWSILQDLFQLNLKVLADRFGLTSRHPGQVATTIRHYVYSNRDFFKIPGSMRPNPFSQKKLLINLFKELFIILINAIPVLFKRNKFGFKWLALSRFFKAFIFPHANEILCSWDSHVNKCIKDMDSFYDVDISSFSLNELIEHREKIEKSAEHYMEPDLAIYVVKMACSWMIEKIGKEIKGKDYISLLTDLTSALEKNQTLDMNTEIEEISKYISSNSELKQLLKNKKYDKVIKALESKNKNLISTFIEKNGHLTTNWDIMEPTWGEDPIKVMHMVRSSIFAENQVSYRDYHNEGQKKYNSGKQLVLDEFHNSKWMDSFFENVLNFLREFMRIDEEHHFYCSRLFKPLRELYIEIGTRFTKQKILSEPGDIFFLTLTEIYKIVEEDNSFSRKYLIQARKNSFKQSLSVRPPDNFIGQMPVSDKKNINIENDKLLIGNGASPGVAIGKVRIIETVEDADDFEQGEVFVTTSPNPAFTPLFAVASALITSTGSILSHGLVSAREYRLPAVIGIPDAPNKLKNGQEVKVDGDNGIIYFI